MGPFPAHVETSRRSFQRRGAPASPRARPHLGDLAERAAGRRAMWRAIPVSGDGEAYRRGDDRPLRSPAVDLEPLLTPEEVAARYRLRDLATARRIVHEAGGFMVRR